MKIRIRHRTTYRYNAPVRFGTHRLMIRPREGHDLQIESSILDITPAHRLLHWMRDVNGNSIAKVDFTEQSDTLMFYSELLLSHYDSNPLDFTLEEAARYYPFVYDPDSQPELAPFIQMLYPKDITAVRDWAAQFWRAGDTLETLSLLQRINHFIHETFQYRRRDEIGVQTPAETLWKNSGSCRDFAALMLETCRFWGLAARFVSGYMLCEATEAGGASTHAWAEVYLPGAGWKGFDPTTGLMTGAQHVTVAVSRNPERAAPISGSFVGLTSAFRNIEVDVSVVQLDGPSHRTAASSAPAHQVPRITAEHVVRQVEQVPQQSAGSPMNAAARLNSGILL
jgi:transglutaminase-like putative cysteine protease